VVLDFLVVNGMVVMKALILICLFTLTAPAVEAQQRGPSEQRGRQNREAPLPPEKPQSTVRSVSGPILGVLYSQEMGLRAVRGIPGAATVGPAVVNVPEFRSWALSAEGAYLIGVRTADNGLTIVHNIGREAVFSEAPKVGIAADMMVVSASGKSAALYDTVRGDVAVLEGLPEAPAIAWSARLETLPGALSALAVRDDAEELLGVAGRSVVMVGRDGGWKHVASIEGPASVRYLNGSGDAVYLDRGLKQVYRVRRTGEGSTITPVAGEADGLSSPLALGVSRDNRRAFVANANPAQVIAADLETGARSATLATCATTGLVPMSGNAVFQLSEADGSPICVLDGDSRQPVTLFVPPPVDGAESGGAR
jgi:hypothetical protein